MRTYWVERAQGHAWYRVLGVRASGLLDMHGKPEKDVTEVVYDFLHVAPAAVICTDLILRNCRG